MNSKTAILTALIATGALAVPANAESTLPQPVQDALATALEDEYHAEAFYDAVMEKFGTLRPFSNIIRAEQNHQAALIQIMKQYDMPVPTNTQLNSTEIRATVPATLTQACSISVKAEIDNAGLYTDKLLPAVKDYADISFVFKNLSDASQYKHLPAFQRCSGR